MDLPTVTCIMPTLPARSALSELAQECFDRQNYPARELLIDERVSEGIGAKRNALCERASAKIIIHWDDDDWSDPDRILRQVEYLISMDRAVTGFHELVYYSRGARKGYRYRHAPPYAIGTSLCYLKSWWEKHPFQEYRPRGEDTEFGRVAREYGQLSSTESQGLIVAIYHGIEQVKPPFRNQAFSRVDYSELPEAFRERAGEI